MPRLDSDSRRKVPGGDSSLVPHVYQALAAAGRRRSRAGAGLLPQVPGAPGTRRRFCTSCGWDLAELYNPEAASPGTAPEEKESSAAPSAEDLEPALASEAPTETPVDAQPQPAGEVDPEPEPSPPPFTPPRKPATLVPPTAAGMTERGVTMFNQGRFQEAIDQFTKAIALDPTYVEAWPAAPRPTPS